MHKGPEPGRMPKHVDKAHLHAMRYASAQARRKGANRVAEQIGGAGRSPAPPRDPSRMPHHTHTHAVSGVQRALDAIGLGRPHRRSQ